MQIKIITIGNEILKDTLDTNSHFLAKELSKIGYIVKKKVSVADDILEIKKEFLSSLKEEIDVIIVTGGLGPTHDDRTKEAIKKAFNIPLYLNKKIFLFLKKKFLKNKVILENQATIPKGSFIVKNNIGTACGFILEKKDDKNKIFIFLPGVPSELKGMFLDVKKFLQKKFSISKIEKSNFINICLLKESEVIKNLKIPKDMKVGIYPSFEKVKIVFSSKNEKKVKIFKKYLIEKFKNFIFLEQSIQEAVKNILISKKKTLSIAESCTGGFVSSKITQIENASLYFLGSIISYSNEIKKSILEVDEKVLQKKGAVSFEVAKEMINGIFIKTKADFAISITGIAGPSGGSKKKPVGLVYIGIGNKNIYVIECQFYGNRQDIINLACNRALSLIYLLAKKGDKNFEKDLKFLHFNYKKF